jgi:uncharacterized membrane protein YwaF
MENKIVEVLNMTAWSMDTPYLFGAFHIAASLLATAFAVLAAVFFARRAEKKKDAGRILAVTGWLLVVLEVYKQCFLYFIVNDGAFDFWFFPFQLCSVPMYLCILLPYIKNSMRAAFMTFMSGYTFVSAAATLVFPEDILRPYIPLTAHGFIWHGLLLFISLLIFLTGCPDASARGLRSAAVLFVILSVIALSINIAVEPFMPAILAAHPDVEHDWAAMFYLNPFHISPQPVISSIQKTAGIPAGLVLYTLVVASVSSIIIKLYGFVSKRR